MKSSDPDTSLSDFEPCRGTKSSQSHPSFIFPPAYVLAALCFIVSFPPCFFLSISGCLLSYFPFLFSLLISLMPPSLVCQAAALSTCLFVHLFLVPLSICPRSCKFLLFYPSILLSVLIYSFSLLLLLELILDE